MARTPRSLAGVTVAITGGGRGIGRATAQALIAEGARVAIGDIDTALAERTAQELGSGTVGLPLDVVDRASFAAFLDVAQARLGPLEVVINNAGIMPIGPFMQERDDLADRIIDINLRGVIIGSKLALERFTARGAGHLVNIASVAGKGGFPGGTTYSATKHAVVGLSDGIRAEYRRAGIDVTVVMPVVVNTELGSGLPPTRLFKRAEPEDVAEAIVGALQHRRYEVYVPRAVGLLMRSKQIVPLAVSDFVMNVLKADRVLAEPDRLAREAYEARVGPVPAAQAPAAERAPEQEPAKVA